LERLGAACAVARKARGMTFRNLIGQRSPITVSFEFFPPKTAEAEESLWHCIKRLEPLNPAFVSVTYGAGGSTRERTHATVRRIVLETPLKPAAHLTCVGSPRDEIDEIVAGYWAAGVRHIVALRGDMPCATGTYRAHPDGYESTPALIQGVRRIAPFEISVAAYPERHPDSPSHAHDIDLLKRKIEAGASRALTQFCFDTEVIVRFRDAAACAGVRVPIVPGLIPTANIKGIVRMAGKAGASVPDWLVALYDGLGDDEETRKTLAAAVLFEQVQELRSEGFDHFHFYTLNQADLAYAACRMLGLKCRLSKQEIVLS
jgi:methylenetetrahydrofolate reductase (NADPH)